MKENNLDKIKAFAAGIEWFGQAAVKLIHNEKIIYIDPYNLSKTDHADLVLITHDHHDHLSFTDLAKIADARTKFIVAEACAQKLREKNYTLVETIKPGGQAIYQNIQIQAVPAYNMVKGYHKKEYNYLGFVLTIEGIRLYHTGDTERVPEMKNIECDILLLPLGQTYTMSNLEEAAEVALDTKAKVVIPIHFGMYEGSRQDVDELISLLQGRVEVMVK
jgi:L-ascorbate metabolism protein UlaG (beta-lactamase superfamily)